MISASPARVIATQELRSSDAKWIQLQRQTYVDGKGTERLWEVASRKTRGKAGVDAVGIGNVIYHPSRPPCTILVMQFRPPVDATTVEWPAGLIDSEETPEEAAVRELKEETGYDGKVISESPAIAADPGMTSANMKLVMTEVYLKEGDPEPEQHLDDGEEIQRLIVPLKDLYATLNELAKQDRVMIAAKLYHWAAGVKYALDHPNLFKQ